MTLQRYTGGPPQKGVQLFERFTKNEQTKPDRGKDLEIKCSKGRHGASRADMTDNAHAHETRTRALCRQTRARESKAHRRFAPTGKSRYAFILIAPRLLQNRFFRRRGAEKPSTTKPYIKKNRHKAGRQRFCYYKKSPAFAGLTTTYSPRGGGISICRSTY